MGEGGVITLSRRTWLAKGCRGRSWRRRIVGAGWIGRMREVGLGRTLLRLRDGIGCEGDGGCFG